MNAVGKLVSRPAAGVHNLKVATCRFHPSTFSKMKIWTSKTIFFVSKKTEAVDSLFRGPTTAAGTFKVRSGGIVFCDLKDEPHSFLVASRYGERFFVSCSWHYSAGRRRLHYLLGVSERSMKMLGIEELSFIEQSELAASLWEKVK